MRRILRKSDAGECYHIRQESELLQLHTEEAELLILTFETDQFLFLAM